MKVSSWASIELALLKKKERRRKKEKSRFLTVSGSVCRRPLWKVPLFVLVVFHMQVTIMTVRRLDFIHRLSYFRFCNVLHIWTIRAIPTYRVYWLYDRHLINTSNHIKQWGKKCSILQYMGMASVDKNYRHTKQKMPGACSQEWFRCRVL